MKKTVLSFLVLFVFFFVNGQAVMAGTFSVDFELDFFNRGINIFTTETFQRYHQVIFNYCFNDGLKFGLIYDWCDDVTSNISTHLVTPWQVTLAKDIYRFDAVLISDIINKEQSYTYYLGTYPSRTIGRDNNCSFQLKLGAKFQPQSLTADLGGSIRKGDFWLGINCLDPIDAKLRDEPDGKNNIPFTIGYEWHPHGETIVNFEFNHFILPSATGMNSWAKIGLIFPLL